MHEINPFVFLAVSRYHSNTLGMSPLLDVADTALE